MIDWGTVPTWSTPAYPAYLLQYTEYSQLTDVLRLIRCGVNKILLSSPPPHVQ